MSEQAFGKIKELLVTDTPPDLGPKPRPGVQTEKSLKPTLDLLLRQTKLSAERQQLIRSLLLLWHDHLDASHNISQTIEDADGSLIHAIMHRREPDYWNSKYWWRRVGNHPVFPEIAKHVGELLSDSPGREEEELVKQLLRGGKWDACAFVDACEAAADLPVGSDRVRLLRAIQQIESEVALGYFLGP